MFVDACQAAGEFTRCCVVSARRMDTKVITGSAAFVVLNSDGWVATAAHVLNFLDQQRDDAPDVAAHRDALDQIAKEQNPNKRLALRKRVKENPDLLTDAGVWWGEDGVSIAEVFAYPDVDLAVLRLEGLTQPNDFPIFKDPTDPLPLGASLVKVGFPFHNVKSRWDEPSQTFQVVKGTLPDGIFPIDGIFTKDVLVGTAPSGFTERWVMTSSPGLMGQSGGPTLDRHGSVWAIQSSTRHLELGFVGKTMAGVEEHQFLNVGLGVHCSTLREVFAQHAVDVRWS